MAAGDLTRADAVLGLTQVDDAHIANGLLGGLITAVSQYVKTRCGRNNLNLVASVTEVLNGSGSDKQFVSEYPVKAITSIAVGGIAQSASIDGVQAGYITDGYGIILLGSVFPRGRQNIRATYTAGYDSVSKPPGDAAHNGAPSDLGHAVAWIIAQTYKRRDWIDQSSKSLAAGETIAFQSWKWPPLIDAVIESYRRSWY